MKNHFALCILCALFSQYSFAQTKDSLKQDNWTNHFQLTFISQKHAGFKSAYSGEKSLANNVEPSASSLTATLFLGRKLWKGAAFYFNPEISGGKGLSFASGVAGALNGETYRVGAVEPAVFIARAYFQQNFPLGNTTYEEVTDDVNQVKNKVPTSRITISAGKFSIADFYDNNAYSKDPRSQFFNWALWANGAWDYPANTRGYIEGIVVELFKPKWSMHLSTVAEPSIANFNKLEYSAKAHSETFEYEHKISINKRPGTIHFLASSTHNRAPSYAEGLEALSNNDTFTLDVIRGNVQNNKFGGSKYALGINIEQELTNDIGLFSRVGWNDGKYVSWAFTEIDRTASIGLSIKGNKWNRPQDVCGIATVVNVISPGHQAFLNAGGYGFIIGDGNLNYGYENIIETYYNAHLSKHLWLTADYQFVRNPGYNKDRGPVNVFGVRGHIEL